MPSCYTTAAHTRQLSHLPEKENRQSGELLSRLSDISHNTRNPQSNTNQIIHFTSETHSTTCSNPDLRRSTTVMSRGRRPLRPEPGDC